MLRVTLRQISRSLFAAALAAITAVPQLLSAQIGHVPAKSPYEDYNTFQTLSVMGGHLTVGSDPAGVAPKAGLLAAVRYDIHIAGPLTLFARYMMAPSERQQLDPTKTKAHRLIGTTNVVTNVFDGGFNMDLTGRKTFYRFIPSIYTGFGIASSFASPDSGNYAFGTSFAFSYGFALRYVTHRGPELRVDIGNTYWKYQYPDKYFVKSSDTTAVLTNTRERSAWRPNVGATIGVTVPIFR